MDKIAPVHPGEILKHEFMEPYGLSSNKLAEILGVPANRVSSIVAGKRSVTGDTALRLGRAFGTTAKFWMNAQAGFDLDTASDEIAAATLSSIEPVGESKPA